MEPTIRFAEGMAERLGNVMGIVAVALAGLGPAGVRTQARAWTSESTTGRTGL